MKNWIFVLSFSATAGFSQLNFEQAQAAAAKYQLGSYSYFENFHGVPSFVGSVVLTNDGGAVAFGDYEDPEASGGLVVKFDKTGADQWKQIVQNSHDEMECQGVIQDAAGNIYVFMLSYNYEKYRGGRERVVCFSTNGVMLWDKTFGADDALNNPIFSYIRKGDDGRIYIRGHVALERPTEESDPIYYFWEGWLDAKGALEEKTNGVINWSDQTWQDWYKP